MSKSTAIVSLASYAWKTDEIIKYLVERRDEKLSTMIMDLEHIIRRASRSMDVVTSAEKTPLRILKAFRLLKVMAGKDGLFCDLIRTLKKYKVEQSPDFRFVQNYLTRTVGLYVEICSYFGLYLPLELQAWYTPRTSVNSLIQTFEQICIIVQHFDPPQKYVWPHATEEEEKNELKKEEKEEKEEKKEEKEKEEKKEEEKENAISLQELNAVAKAIYEDCNQLWNLVVKTPNFKIIDPETSACHIL